ncbi:hypothetical protein ABT364_26255 [Massilia sp. SR12]
MKKIILAMAAISVFSSNASACKLNTFDTPLVREVVQQHGGWPISDEKCAVLNKYNLALFVSGQATVLSNTSIAWTEVKLTLPGLNIVSDKSQTSTYVNTSNASIATARDILYEAIRDAIVGLDFEGAAMEIRQYQVKAARQSAASPGKR